MKLRLAGIVAVVFMTSAFVHACSCVTVPSHGPCEGLPKSGFLFIGTVISITPEQPPEVQADGTLVEYFGGDRKVTLRVDERFAGALGPEFEVTTGSGGGDCGYPFELGGSYLVEADIWKGKAYTGICSTTSEIERVPHLIEQLRRMGKGEQPASIYGVLRQYVQDPFSYNPLIEGGNSLQRHLSEVTGLNKRCCHRRLRRSCHLAIPFGIQISGFSSGRMQQRGLDERVT